MKPEWGIGTCKFVTSWSEVRVTWEPPNLTLVSEVRTIMWGLALNLWRLAQLWGLHVRTHCKRHKTFFLIKEFIVSSETKEENSKKLKKRNVWNHSLVFSSSINYKWKGILHFLSSKAVHNYKLLQRSKERGEISDLRKACSTTAMLLK